MTTHTTHNFKLFIGMLGLVLAAGTANAAVISIPDHSFTPDGSATVSEQDTNINALNGNTNVLTTGATKVAYFITTFNFGTGSNAHLIANFETAFGGITRIGVRINDDGLVDTVGVGAQTLSIAQPSRTTLDLAQDMAGTSVVVLAKLLYDSNHNVLYGSSDGNSDTLMNVWINPDFLSVEGSGFAAGDLYALWNSAGFGGFEQTIENQNTLGTAGTSSITNTVILTGADATFAKALQAAGVPAPAALPAGLAMLGLIAMHRRPMK